MEQEYQAGMDLYNPELVNVTTYSSHGTERNTLDTFDYVRKRISPDRVSTVVEKVEKLMDFERQKTDTPTTYDFTKSHDIEQYCQDRLAEIVLINDLSHTPSAVVAIAAFMGFLSLLAYGKNKRNGDDSICFRKFVRRFMYNKGYSPDRMYKTFRCGIVHAMSFYPALRRGRNADKPRSKRYPKLLITHSSDVDNLSIQQFRGKVPVLMVQQLCVDIKESITSMFKDKKVCRNAIQFLSWQPAIVCNVAKTTSTDDNQVSGYYTK